MKEYVPTYPNPDDDDRPDWEKKLRPLFSAAEDKDGEGARPSSLIPACKMPDPGLGYELMLMRELKITNERTVRELGPLPPGGLPVQKKRKPTRPYTDFLGCPVPDVPLIIEENDEMRLSQIVAPAALSAAVMAGVCTATDAPLPTGKQTPSIAISSNATRSETAIPKEIRSFVPKDSTLLAYKRFDLMGSGREDVVLIVRHPVTDDYADYSKNPCDLLVLRAKLEGFELAGKSSKAIDCTYKTYTREVANKQDDLNDIINLKPFEISCDNEKDMGGGSTYHFKYSTERHAWHLGRVEVNYSLSKENGMEFYEQIASYPNDFEWISMADFDPNNADLERMLEKNKSLFK